MPAATKLQQGKNGKLASKRSKTQDPKCSAAASLFARKQATADTYKILGECRSKARMAGQANQQRAAGNEARAQVLEKRAERGLTIKDRVAKAKELIAQRKAGGTARVAEVKPAGPSLREQVQAKRAERKLTSGKDRSGRAEFAKRERDAYRTGRKDAEFNPDYHLGSPARDGVKTATSRRERFTTAVNELRAKHVAKRTMYGAPKPLTNQDYTQAIEGKAYAAGVESGLRRVLAQRAAKPAPMAVQPRPSALEQARSARAAKGDRTTRLKALAEKSMSLAESRATRAGSLSGSAQDRMIDRSMSAADRYNRLEAARTPYKAAVPAIKSGLPTTKGGVPAETPKMSLLEQARIKRAVKNADRNRDGRLAARAKKQYDAARRNMKANLDKAKALGPGTGEKYVEKATKYGKRLEVASKRYVKLHDMWATGGKFVQARVVN